MPRYAETTKLLERDLEGVSPDAAVKNIEMWQESLAELDSKEAKAISKDLEALKKEMNKKSPSLEKLMDLLGRLGEATTAIADQAPENVAEKIRGIGEALTENAEEVGRADDSAEVEETEGETEGEEAAPKRRAKG